MARGTLADTPDRSNGSSGDDWGEYQDCLRSSTCKRHYCSDLIKSLEKAVSTVLTVSRCRSRSRSSRRYSALL